MITKHLSQIRIHRNQHQERRMVRNRNRRSGFTLPEVLVTVAIVAILAAVVVPTVTQQIGKGDDSNFVAGVAGVKTGITGFVADTRKFPGHIEDLFTRPAATDKDPSSPTGADYGTVAVARWNGPYNDGSYNPANGLLLGQVTLLDTTRIISGVLTLYIHADGEAMRLHADTLLDDGVATTGNLTWLATASDTTMKYKLMPAH